ncbi:hypothetical protein [Pseudomonas cremoricolorata]|uniref:hypothetical protein n=1 Tax=Pseudomonas cremoricolorata TaxID=157783 RepID=UPI0012B64428|nr:hypothetical protein [Pseudomonas cremoricolorata]
MKKVMASAALVMCSGNSFSAVVAEKIVIQDGYTIRLQLLDEEVAGPIEKFIKCQFGVNLARLSSEVVGAPQTNELQALGCWVVNRDGFIEFSATDHHTGHPIYLKTSVDQYTTAPAFTSWGDYMASHTLDAR